jgi:signal peptidase II
VKKRLEEIKTSLLWWPTLIVLAVIILDQITKIWTLQASGDIPHGPPLYVVIEDYFNFVDYRNTGAAWGMFSGNPRLLSMVSLLAFIYFIYDFPNLTEGIGFRRFSWALLIGGVFGNFIDRFFRLEVIDMIQVNIPFPEFTHSMLPSFIRLNENGMYNFPAFNIADAGICVGVFLYLVHVVFFSKKKVIDEKSKKAETEKAEKETQAQ